MSKEFPQIMHNARKGKNLTLKKLSIITGISIGHLSEAERGETTLGGEKLLSVCRTLGICLDAQTDVQNQTQQQNQFTPASDQQQNSVYETMETVYSAPDQRGYIKAVVEELWELPKTEQREILRMILNRESKEG